MCVCWGCAGRLISSHAKQQAVGCRVSWLFPAIDPRSLGEALAGCFGLRLGYFRNILNPSRTTAITRSLFQNTCQLKIVLPFCSLLPASALPPKQLRRSELTFAKENAWPVNPVLCSFSPGTKESNPFEHLPSPPLFSWEPNSGHLLEQEMLLTTESPLLSLKTWNGGRERQIYAYLRPAWSIA